jgi:hypothetical protein
MMNVRDAWVCEQLSTPTRLPLFQTVNSPSNETGVVKMMFLVDWDNFLIETHARVGRRF